MKARSPSCGSRHHHAARREAPSFRAKHRKPAGRGGLVRTSGLQNTTFQCAIIPSCGPFFIKIHKRRRRGQLHAIWPRPPRAAATSPGAAGRQQPSRNKRHRAHRNGQLPKECGGTGCQMRVQFARRVRGIFFCRGINVIRCRIGQVFSGKFR